MEKIIIELIEDGKMPEKTHISDSCYDVIAREVIHNERYITYKLGFKTEIPEGYEGLVLPRSSIRKYDLVMTNSPGIIDESYRGEWEASFKIGMPNLTLNDDELKDSYGDNGPVIYKVGDKVAQIKFIKKEESQEFELGKVSNDTERGEGGFGSTGK